MDTSVKAILFDYGGTLDHDGGTWGERFFALYKEEGLAVSPDRLQKAFYAADDALPARHALPGLGLAETVSLQVQGVLEALGEDRPELSRRVAERFIEDSRRALSRNRPLLERLSRRFRLGIVSNFYGNLEDVLRAEGLRGLFGAVADSAVVGHIKPGPEIFQSALGVLGVSAKEAMMVGDSLPRDMKGAEALGMPHAWLSPSSAAACCPRGLRLRALSDLESLLAPVEAGS